MTANVKKVKGHKDLIAMSMIAARFPCKRFVNFTYIDLDTSQDDCSPVANGRVPDRVKALDHLRNLNPISTQSGLTYVLAF